MTLVTVSVIVLLFVQLEKWAWKKIKEAKRDHEVSKVDDFFINIFAGT